MYFQDLRKRNKTSLHMHHFEIIIEKGYTSPFSSRPLNRLAHFTANRKTKINTATVIKKPKHVKSSTDSSTSTNITVTSCQARAILRIHSQGEKLFPTKAQKAAGWVTDGDNASCRGSACKNGVSPCYTDFAADIYLAESK